MTQLVIIDQKLNSFFCQYGDEFGALDKPILPSSGAHSGTGKISTTEKEAFVLTPEAAGKLISLWKPMERKALHREE